MHNKRISSLHSWGHCTIIDSINLNSSRHTRNNRFSNYNFICPHCNRATEGERTFLVQAVRTRNSLPAFIKKQASLKSFKRAIRGNFFQEQLDFLDFYMKVLINIIS